jgi:hypothetical protein
LNNLVEAAETAREVDAQTPEENFLGRVGLGNAAEPDRFRAYPKMMFVERRRLFRF